MKSLLNRYVQGLFKFRVFVLFAVTVLTVSFLFLAPKVKMDNSVDVFFDKQSPSYVDFQSWKEQFGSDELIIVALHHNNIFTFDNLTAIKKITQKIELLDNVAEVTSITNVNDIVGDDQDFIVRQFIEDVPKEKAALNQLADQAKSNPIYLNRIVSSDSKTTALIIELERSKEKSDVYKLELIDRIKNVLKQDASGFEYYLSGYTMIENAYTSYMRSDLSRFIPLMMGIIFVILLISFRNFTGVVLAFTTIVVSLVWTFALMYFFKFSINNITTLIPPIILAIAVADSVHLTSAGFSQISKDRIKDVVLKLAGPCFMTSLTTVIGFLSLTVSDIRPIVQLGIVAASGVAIAFILTFTFLPAVLFVLVSVKKDKAFDENSVPKKTGSFEKKLNALSSFNQRFYKPVLFVTAVLTVIAVVGALKVRPETSVLEYFKKNSPIYKSTKFIEDNLSGTHFLNLSLKSSRFDYFKSPNALLKIEKINDFLKTVPEVDTVVSLNDYIKEINKSFNNEDESFYVIPKEKDQISQYLLLYGASDLAKSVDSDFSWATVEVRLNEHRSGKLKAVIKKIEDYAQEVFGQEAEVTGLGLTVLEVNANDTVMVSQVKSLGFAFVMIFAVLFIMFRSFSLGTVSIVPNLLALVFNFGIMGFFGIYLNSATSMISAIGIGIIVDDTIHFLHSFRASFNQTKNPAISVHQALIEKGKPIVLTSVILFFGFGVIAFSQFGPSFYFGILSAIVMFNALLADLIVLPSLLLLVYKGR